MCSKSLAAAVCWVLTLVAPAVGQAQETMRVHFIDVGQGDATLIEFPCGTMLIDTGGERNPKDEWKPAVYDSNRVLVDYLGGVFDARGEDDPRLDLLVLTHPHKDHTRGVADVVREFAPRNVVYNGQLEGYHSGSEGQLEVVDYVRGSDASGWYVLQHTIETLGEHARSIIDPIDCGSIDPEIEVLWGRVRDNPGWYYDDFGTPNNHSVVVRVDFGDASILFTGDLEEPSYDARQAGFTRAGTESLVDSYRGTRKLDVDVYHVGHHGSHNGTSEQLLRAMSPEIAVISAGPPCPAGEYSAWVHAHPREITLGELVDMGNGVSGNRPTPVDAFVFPAWRTSPERKTVSKAVYSTSWDGTVILHATGDGSWTLDHRATQPRCQ